MVDTGRKCGPKRRRYDKDAKKGGDDFFLVAASLPFSTHVHLDIYLDGYTEYINQVSKTPPSPNLYVISRTFF